jgi:transposase
MAGASRVRLGSMGKPRGEGAGRGPERNYNGRPQGTDCVRMVHLIRDVKFLTTLPDARDRAYGERLREALRQLFAVIHRREQLSATVFQSQLEAARAEVLRCGTRDVPESKPSRNLTKRLETHGESYFRFITTPGVDPTNNLAEQAIRFVVLDRLVTQGTRSEAGNR